MRNKKQTAVEWLMENLHTAKDPFTQAKQMEKEQIMLAVKDSWYMAKGSNIQEPQEENYYKETYKTAIDGTN